ncbi:hypothetical protein LINPERHAP2_LOCUS29146 [Linum perenne]
MVRDAPTASPPLLEVIVDLVTLCSIFAILILSLVSLLFVFHLYLKSTTAAGSSSRHLRSFNSLWSARFCLVLFITLWALTNLIRIPTFRRSYTPKGLTVSQQVVLCKLHVSLSLGLFEPGFLVTLLYLVNISVNKTAPPRHSFAAFLFVSVACLPPFLLQIFIVAFGASVFHLPAFFNRSYLIPKSVLSGKEHNNTDEDEVLCLYPFMSCIVFGGFVVWYLVAFSISCFKALTLVINKGLRMRLYGLTLVVMITLPLQLVSLGFSVMWTPRDEAYAVLSLMIFLTALVIAAVGEGILVIRPIADSLAVGSQEIQLGGSRQQDQATATTTTAGEEEIAMVAVVGAGDRNGSGGGSSVQV